MLRGAYAAARPRQLRRHRCGAGVAPLEPGSAVHPAHGREGVGDEVDLSLVFSDGSTQDLVVPVKAFTEEEGHYHAPGTGDHDH